MSVRFKRCTHHYGALGVHCEECDPRTQIDEQIETIEKLRADVERMKAQRDLALFLGLKFSRGVYESCPAANAFEEFQELRAKILKTEGYHPGWNRPDSADFQKIFDKMK
jgi:hypothetical protein